MDITGTIKVINDTNQVSEKFKKRDFVITENSSQYPQHILFQATQDKCSLLDNVKVGDEVTIHFNLRGREWTNSDGKTQYFNSLEMWRIVKDNNDFRHGNTEYRDEKDYKKPDFDKQSKQEDDLPF